MERLTERLVNGDVRISGTNLVYSKRSAGKLAAAVAGLAAYEDTGRTPEDIKNSLTDATDLAKVAMALRKLRNYEEAEQEGRLVVLPCKVGATVYVLNASKFHKGEAYEGCVSSFHYSFHGLEMLGTGFYGRVDDLLNKKVFFTREEAEAKLKGAGDEKTD